MPLTVPCRTLARIAAAAVIAAVVAHPTPAAADSEGKAEALCRTVRQEVAMAPGKPATETISATFCQPRGRTDTVDILVPGGTYNSEYWRWPENRSRQSYVDAALADGRATFSYDRLGTGQSSRPASLAVGFAAETYILHQLVSTLRDDFDEVNLVGHSIGSLIAIEEAARYNDVDRLVVTSMLHGLAVNLGSAFLAATFHPAALDPVYGDTNLDPGWLTTRPGVRSKVFYDNRNVDPEVLAYDEAHKDIWSERSVLDALLANKLPAPLNSSNRVKVPVLVVVGENDELYCNLLVTCRSDKAVYLNEKPFFTSAPSLDAVVIPDTGHNLTLHRSAPQSYAVIADWLESH